VGVCAELIDVVREPNEFGDSHGGNRARPPRLPRQYKPSEYEARQPPAVRSRSARYQQIRENRMREMTVDASGVALPMDVEDW